MAQTKNTRSGSKIKPDDRLQSSAGKQKSSGDRRQSSGGERQISGRKRFSLSDNQKWVAGLVLFFFAIYALWICASYLFTWNTDQAFEFGDTILRGDPTEASRAAAAASATEFVSAADAITTGEKGSFGVRFARLMVGRGFGCFAMAIPVIFIIIGLRLMRYRPAALERSVRIALSAMILGSVTLGLIFGTRWGVFGTGLGGEMGIFAAEWLRLHIGLVGSGLALLCLWILLAVYISVKNISRVNRVGQALADGGEFMSGLVTSRRDAGAEDEEYDDDEVESIEDEAEYDAGAGSGFGSGLQEESSPVAADSPFVVRDIDG
ncbi:MAG: DNA translocase FtsK 4TM domain-containing protein, partial [Alistipes sp.]|nr:DNA translocase FtsK 4TM domain-containing protein [Alistipes sp.]